jgi:hypothetical protein
MAGKINKGRRFFFCETAQQTDLDQAGFEALTWVEVGQIVNVGETGSNTNVVSQDYWGTEVTQKRTGITNAGDPTVEVGEDLNDAGQNAMRAVANDGNFYAFRIDNLLLSGQTTPARTYNRGLVLGPVTNNGGVEDWANHVFTLGLVQEQLLVDPT